MPLPATITTAAELSLSLYRHDTGRALWVIAGRVPGDDWQRREQSCDLSDIDEAYTWANDFHGLSKGYRSLMDCVADDWISHQLSLP